jgi:hypothetical protein
MSQKQTKEQIQRQRALEEMKVEEQRANDPTWTRSRRRVSDKARDARYKEEDAKRDEQNRRDRAREQELYIQQKQAEYTAGNLIKPRQSQAKTFKLNMRTGEILPAGPGAKKQNDRNYRILTKDHKQAEKYDFYKYGEQLSKEIKDMNNNPQTRQMYSDLMDEYEGLGSESMTGKELMNSNEFLRRTNWILTKLEPKPATERENKTPIKWTEGQNLPTSETRSQYEEKQDTPKKTIRWKEGQDLPTPETRSQFELKPYEEKQDTPKKTIRWKEGQDLPTPETRSQFELKPYEEKLEQPVFTPNIRWRDGQELPNSDIRNQNAVPFQRPEPYTQSTRMKKDMDEYKRTRTEPDYMLPEDRAARDKIYYELFPYMKDNTLGVLPEDGLQDIPRLNQSVGSFDINESDGVFRGTDWIDGLNPNAQDVIDTPNLQTGTIYTQQEDELKYKDVDDITPQDLITQSMYDLAFIENNPYAIDYGFLQDKIKEENDSLYNLQKTMLDEFNQIASSKGSFVNGGYDVNTSSMNGPDLNPMNQYAQAGVQKWDDELDVNPIFLRQPITDENYSFGYVEAGIPLTNQQQMTRYHYDQHERSLLNSLTQSASRLMGDNNVIDGNSNTIFKESLDRIKLSDDSANGNKTRAFGLYGLDGNIFNDNTVPNPRTMETRVKTFRNTLANKKKYDRYSKNPMSYGYTSVVSQPSIDTVRSANIPYRQPDRYYAANAVNLVRLGNQTSMKTDNEYAV